MAQLDYHCPFERRAFSRVRSEPRCHGLRSTVPVSRSSLVSQTLALVWVCSSPRSVPNAAYLHQRVPSGPRQGVDDRWRHHPIYARVGNGRQRADGIPSWTPRQVRDESGAS
jgi:hypothetical protein